MTPRTRTLTIAGTRYRVSERSYDAYLSVAGPGLVGGLVIPGPLDAADLRERVAAEVAGYRERRQTALARLQEQQRLGNVPG